MPARRIRLLLPIYRRFKPKEYSLRQRNGNINPVETIMTNQITLQNGDGVMWWEDGDYLLTTSACVNLSNAADTWNGTNSSDLRLLRFEHDAFTAGQSNGDRCVCRINGYSINGTYNTLGDTSYWYQPFWSSSADNWNCSTGCAERCLVTIEGGGINYFLSKQLHSPVFYQTSCMPKNITLNHFDGNGTKYTSVDTQYSQCTFDTESGTNWNLFTPPAKPGYSFAGWAVSQN